MTLHHSTTLIKIALVLVFVLAVGTPLRAADDPKELLLYNGRFYTLNPQQPFAAAVLIRDNKIAFVGSVEDASAAAGSDAQSIDLMGRFAVPGFIDTHVHLASAARFHEFNLMTTSNQDEFVERVSLICKSLPPGEWITGGLWGAYDQWELGSAGSESRSAPFAPQMQLVNSISAAHPIFIRRFDNSEFAANDLALGKAGIDPVDPEPIEGIEFIRDDAGRFTGRMRGPTVARMFGRVVPREISYARRIDQTRNALQMAARFGVTMLSDMSDDTQLTIYRDLRQRGELTARIDFRYTLDRWKEVADRGIRVGSGDDWIQLGGLKGFIDGIMGTSSARFFEPYSHDPTSRGRWREMMKNEQGEVDPQRFLELMLGADRAGLQITVHAIGDEANHVLMNFVEHLNEQNGRRDRRFRLVHAQVISDDDFQRLGELGIIAEVQPFHLSDDMRWMEERIGAERCRGAYAFERIRQSGARLCFGSDWPGTSAAEYPINPMLALYAAVSRQTVNGTPAEGWFPDQRLSMETAIKAHTLDAAYALFAEDRIGSLQVGKQADLVVLSRDLLSASAEEILTAEPVYTIVDGQVVYQSAEE